MNSNVNNNVNVNGQQRRAGNSGAGTGIGAGARMGTGGAKVRREVVVLWRELGDGETRTYEFVGAFTGRAANGNRYAGLVLRDGRLLFAHEPEVIEAVHDAATKHGAGVRLSGSATYTARVNASGYKRVSPVGFTLSVSLPLSRRLSAAGAVIDEAATSTVSIRYVPPSTPASAQASTPATATAPVMNTPTPTPEPDGDEESAEEEYLYTDSDSDEDEDEGEDVEGEEDADPDADPGSGDAGSAEDEE